MIIKTAKEDLSRSPYQNILYPNQFVSATEKQSKAWIKSSMDYYANCAYAQYTRNCETFVKNYDLVNGILTGEDFYEEPEIKSFTELLLADMDLPKYVQSYSIFNGPLSSAIGELTRRPDSHRVKAFDDESRSQEMQFRTQLLEKYVFQLVRDQIANQFAMEGKELPADEEEKITLEKVKEQVSDYTSDLEGWANHVLEACKVAFNMKEQSEEGFRDLFICGREYYLPIEDNSKLGFHVKGVNTKNVWFHTVPDQKWTAKAFFGGTIEVMEISQIMEEIPDLTVEEINHLREGYNTFGVLGVEPSNYGTSASGTGTIKYNTYSPLLVQEELKAESLVMGENNDSLGRIFGLGTNIGAFGQKYIVVRAYWLSKMKVKYVTFINEDGMEDSMLVDETYQSGDLPNELSVEEGWINQWYEGTKIGPDVYIVKPYKLLDRFPVIGINYNIRNSEVRAPIDFLKPFQAIYNLCMNQLWELLNKEKGPVLKIQLRRIPTPKDGSETDALEQWMMDAEERGIVFEDDSPENLKAPMPNTSQTQVLDWSLTKMIQSRYELAAMIKNEAYELIGFSRQRLASVQATETATATNTAIAQSYAQTEPLFAAHDYLLDQVYQAIVDCAQYTQSQKPSSTISYLTDMGESASVEVMGDDLKARDFWVFSTSRPQDQEMFNKLQDLAQPYMQNGGDLSEVVELFTNKSVRALQKVYTDFKAKRDAMMQQQTQLEEAKLQQTQQIAKAQLEQQERQHQEDLANENMNKAADRKMQIDRAIITALGMSKNTGADTNQDSVADIYQTEQLLQKANEISKKHDVELQKLAVERDKMNQENINKEKDRQVERENMQNDLAISKQNAKGRSKSKPKK